MVVAHAVPTTKDYWVGRSKACYANEGNQYLLKLVTERFKEYNIADVKSDYLDVGTKKSQFDIKCEIVEAIKSSGGQFLKKDKKNNKKNGEWRVLSDDEALRIVRDVFATVRRRRLQNKPDLTITTTQKKKSREATSTATPKVPDGSLTFTKVLEILEVTLSDADRTRLFGKFGGDNVDGLIQFMSYLEGDDGSAVFVPWNIRPLDGTRLHKFRMWFERVYVPAKADSKPTFCRETWINFLEVQAKSEKPSMGIAVESTTEPQGEAHKDRPPGLLSPQNELHDVDYPLGSKTKHPGKEAVRRWVEEFLEEYKEADQKSVRTTPDGRSLRSKSEIITDILHRLWELGGAVKREDVGGEARGGRWSIVNAREARRQIVFDFINAIKRKEKRRATVVARPAGAVMTKDTDDDCASVAMSHMSWSMTSFHISLSTSPSKVEGELSWSVTVQGDVLSVDLTFDTLSINSLNISTGSSAGVWNCLTCGFRNTSKLDQCAWCGMMRSLTSGSQKKATNPESIAIDGNQDSSASASPTNHKDEGEDDVICVEETKDDSCETQLHLSSLKSDSNSDPLWTKALSSVATMSTMTDVYRDEKEWKIRQRLQRQEEVGRIQEIITASVEATDRIESYVGQLQEDIDNEPNVEFLVEEIAHLAVSVENQSIISLSGGLETSGTEILIEALRKHASREQIQRNGILALAALTVKYHDNRVAIVMLGGIQIVIEAMSKFVDSESLQHYSCLALANLSGGDNDDVITSLGGTEAVVSAMTKYADNEELQSYGCLALANLACNSKENRVAVAKQGGIELAVGAMTRFDNSEQLQNNGCLALRNFAFHDDENRLAIVRQGGVELVRKVMKKFDRNKQLQDDALLAHGTLTGSNDDKRKPIAKQGGMGFLVSKATKN